MNDKTLERDLAAGIKYAEPINEPINKAAVKPLFTSTMPIDGYVELERILKLAYNQSATGKGKERHATAGTNAVMAWHEQPILANARQVGPGGPAMQVMKKAGESVTMAGNRNFAGAKAEALGAIVYAAALYKLYEEMEQAKV